MKVVKVLFVIGALFGGAILVKGAGAMTYQDAVDVEFTLDSTLSISLSANALSIDNLVPGNSARSNTILVDVETNNVYGYALTAKVGGMMAGASTSNALVNGGSSFSSLATSDNLTLADFDADTWGYTTASAINSSTTYSGLLYDADTTINMTTGVRGKSVAGYPGTNSTSFTIGASASSGKLAGDYTNVISFMVVTNNPSITINDLTYMQDFASLSENDKSTVIDYMEADRQYTLTDNRDNHTYTVAKLCMNKVGDVCTEYGVWMTQNLDLQIGGTYNNEPIVLTSENTDLNQYDVSGQGTGNLYTDYAYNNGVITWTPTLANTNATVTGNPASLTTDNGTTVTGWTNDNNIPYMMDGGDRYSVQGARFNSLSACEANGTRTEATCMHYHVGNYYNFSAAVAMSNTGTYAADNTVMPNSICPKGWRLPNGITDDNGTKVQSDFNKLLTTYDIAGGTDTTGSTNVAKSNWNTVGYVNIGLSPLFFARSGFVLGSSLYSFGANGNYWSSTVSGTSSAYSLGYSSTELYPAYRSGRLDGRSVRCMAR